MFENEFHGPGTHLHHVDHLEKPSAEFYAWGGIHTFVTGELVTAATMNTYISNNLAYLHGDAGTVAIGAAMNITGTFTATGDLVAGQLISSGRILVANMDVLGQPYAGRNHLNAVVGASATTSYSISFTSAFVGAGLRACVMTVIGNPNGFSLSSFSNSAVTIGNAGASGLSVHVLAVGTSS